MTLTINRFVCFILAILFIWFAYLQVNDPDPWVWIPPYLYIALLGSVLALRPSARINFFLNAGMIFYGIWTLTFIPDLIFWLKAGMPEITGRMQEKHPYIELVREMGGLIIVLVANIYFSILKRIYAKL